MCNFCDELKDLLREKITKHRFDHKFDERNEYDKNCLVREFTKVANILLEVEKLELRIERLEQDVKNLEK